MLKERHRIFTRLDIFANGVLAGLSYMAALAIRAYLDTGFFLISAPYSKYLWGGYVVSLLWAALLYANGIHPVSRFRTIKKAIGIIVKSGFQGMLLMLAALFIFRLHFVSRIVVIIFTFAATLVLILKESFIIYILHNARERGINFRNIIIIGSVESGHRIVSKIRENSYLGLKVLGFIVTEAEFHRAVSGKEKILGSLSSAQDILDSNAVDSVIITMDSHDYADAEEIIFYCEERGIEICFIPDMLNIKAARLDTDEILGIPLVTFNMGPKFSWQILAKSLFDRIFGFLLFLSSLPALFISSALIKATTKGPVIFKQKRCGLRGKEFTLYKLRTMYEDAEEKKKSLEEKNMMDGPVFKLENDPRITFVGRFLRKTSIDELPQLWNVIKGDMSLIGPRPPIPEEVKKYKGWQRRRLSMKPGITGLWQVKGRSEITDFDKWAALDLRYIDRWSLWLDVVIFFKTILVVLSCKGAR
jgi:exopolysaccharide biosynthesis polyprenyl glycosylphosphotransferase